MEINMHPSWQKILEDEFNLEYFQKLSQFVDAEYASNICFPPKEQIFAAFENLPFQDVKVVIIGQDPYHGDGQANGFCFSVNDGVKFPPSLINIFKEIQNDLGQEIPFWGNLERWSKQGVLLLNATLTVRRSEAGSHQKQGWEVFTDTIIREISAQSSNVVFMLWGNFAIKKGKKIDAKKHHILVSGHPSPMSANQGKWFGNKHFSQANEYLKNHLIKPIDW